MKQSNISQETLKKNQYVSYKLYKKVLSLKETSQFHIIKTWSRASTIIPLMVGYTISVYNGKKHIPVVISEQLVGHKLGEFVPTRAFKSHKKTAKKIKK